jgi:hypothetical protein
LAQRAAQSARDSAIYMSNKNGGLTDGAEEAAIIWPVEDGKTVARAEWVAELTLKGVQLIGQLSIWRVIQTANLDEFIACGRHVSPCRRSSDRWSEVPCRVRDPR